MNTPTNLKYAASHEWARLDADGSVTIGITDHAQEALGDIVFLELPAVGRVVAAGEECAVVESVKAASEIYAPVTGTMIEVNVALTSEPGLINTSPDAEGWIFKIAPDAPAEFETLLDDAAYAKHTA